MNKTREPNFIIGGTAAGGTSFLSAILVQHPQIYLPKEMRPEPHYFYKSWEYEKGLNYYLSRWFDDVPQSAIAVGERSSSYFFGGEIVAKRIKEVYPNMKFILTLRNPIERTWANYRYTALQGLESLSFEDALKNEERRIREQSGEWAEIQPYNYTGRGLYAKQIHSFLKFFSAENILFIKSELLSKQTEFELKKIYKFLKLTDIDFTFKPAPNHTSLSVSDPALQMELRQYFGDRFDKIIEATRKEEGIDNFILSPLDKEKIEQLSENMAGLKKPMPFEARAVLNEKFSADIQELSRYVDFDTSDWN